MVLPHAPLDCIAVVFLSKLTREDGIGYAEAARAMELAAAEQPGFCGFVAARGEDGVGIAVSYWADEKAAAAWRANEDHIRTIEHGRARWYEAYSISVSTVKRSYDWQRSAS